jgi:hypothetical protein
MKTPSGKNASTEKMIPIRYQPRPALLVRDADKRKEISITGGDH